MTADNRTNEPKQNETKSGQEFCFTEAQVEAAAKVLAPDGVFAKDFGEYSRKRDNYRREDQAEEQRYYMRKARAALVAAAGAAPQAESDDSLTPGNHATEEALEHLESLRHKGTVEYADYVALHDHITAIAPVLPSSKGPQWSCGKCVRMGSRGFDDGQIPAHHHTCPKLGEKSQGDIDRDGLAKLMLAHRRSVQADFGGGRYGYTCLCGEELRSDSHHVIAEHQASVIAAALGGESRAAGE